MEKNRFFKFFQKLMPTVEFFFLHFLLVYLQTITVINLNFLACFRSKLWRPELSQVNFMGTLCATAKPPFCLKKKIKFFCILLGYINNSTKFHDNRIKTSL